MATLFNVFFVRSLVRHIFNFPLVNLLVTLLNMVGILYPWHKVCQPIQRGRDILERRPLSILEVRQQCAAVISVLISLVNDRKPSQVKIMCCPHYCVDAFQTLGCKEFTLQCWETISIGGPEIQKLSLSLIWRSWRCLPITEAGAGHLLVVWLRVQFF